MTRRRGRRHARSTGPSCWPRPRPPWALVANLPYNVATPLVLDLLDEVPAIERMLVMVQREVGERLAAAPGTKTYGIPSVKVGLLGRPPTSSAGCRPTSSCPSPRVESALVAHRPARPAPAVDADPSRAVRPRRAGLRPAPQDAAPVAGRGVVDAAEAFARRRRVGPRPAAEELDVEALGPPAPTRRRRSSRPGDGRVTSTSARPSSCAPAKLTLSLRVTGRARRRLPPDRRRDGQPRPGTTARPSATATASRSAAASTADVARRRRQPGAPGAAGRRPHGARRASTSASRPAPGWAAARPTPPPSSAGRAVDDLELAAAASAPTCRSAWSAVGPGSPASARWSSRCPFEARTFTLLTPPFGCSTPAVYRAWDDLGGPTADGANDLEPAALPVEPRAGRVARPARRRHRADARAWPAAARTWFVGGRRFPGRRGVALVRDPDTRRPPPGRGGRSLRQVVPGAAGYLPAARRWKRVRFSIFLCFFLRMRLRRFLISEPMAGCTVSPPPPRTLRTHDGARSGAGYRGHTLAGSSTGRTPDFGSGGWRFEPSPASPVTGSRPPPAPGPSACPPRRGHCCV